MRMIVRSLALAPLCLLATPLCFLALATLGAPAQAASLTLVCLNVGRMVDACQANASVFAEETGHTVRVVSAPFNSRQAL